MQPSGTATLQLQGVTIADNSVSGEGGGISMSGSTTLYSDGTTYITGNSAGSNGGGIKLAAPATAYISSNINNNTRGLRRRHRRLFVRKQSGRRPSVFVEQYGLGIDLRQHGHELKAAASTSRPPTAHRQSLCAQDFSIDANKAFDGSAIYADINGTDGAFIDINPTGSTCAGSSNPFPPIPCPTGQYCNEIADNVDPGTNGDPAPVPPSRLPKAAESSPAVLPHAATAPPS